MEEALGKLKKIGADRISKETHITASKLQYILDQKFDLLDKTTALGFIHILEREYEVDLTEWVEAYEAYLGEQQPEEGEEEGVFVSREDMPAKSNKLLYLIVLILLGGGYYLYTHPELINTIQKPAENKTMPEKEESTTPPQPESKAALKAEEKPEASGAAEEETASKDENAPQKAEESSPAETAEESKPAETVAEANVTLIQPIVETPEADLKNIMITPHARVWVGIVYLDTFEKEDFITEEPIVINSNREHIMVLGHGDIELTRDTNTTRLFEKNPIRFHYNGKTFDIITVQKFRDLNRGEIW